MSYTTTQQRAGWTDAQSFLYIVLAAGKAEFQDENDDPIPWHWFPISTPGWKRMIRHWQELNSWPIWDPVYAGTVMTGLYQHYGQTKDTGQTWRQQLDALWVYADPENN